MPATKHAARQPLTARQELVYEFILEFLVEHHRQPSLQEIAAKLGSDYRVAALCHVRALVRKGWLDVRRKSGRIVYRLTGARIEIVRDYMDEAWTLADGPCEARDPAA